MLLRNNPHDWQIEDLLTIAKRYGIDADQGATSHVTFRPWAGRETIPAAKLILKLIDKLRGGTAP